MADRGVYRGVYSALPDDPDFQQLPAEARLVFYTVRLCKAAGPACMFRYYPELVMIQAGLSRKALDRAFEDLERGGWIEREGPILWVRNGLRYDPNIRLADQKHRKSVERAISELPRLAIVLRFCDYYEIARPFEGPTKTSPGLALRDRVGDRVGDREGLPSNPSPRAEEPADWSTAAWPSPEALAQLYNEAGPDNLPAVETLSQKRRDAAKKMLRQFPDRAWWVDVFAEYRQSAFLSGRRPPGPGHEGFKPDFDWLMANGKKGAENAVRVHDGVYR